MIDKENKIINLWREQAPLQQQQEADGDCLFSNNLVFPSARQALSFSLEELGFRRGKRVAVPAWSSHCVFGAVAKYADPVSLEVVIKNNVKVDAILLYEQWGWPFTKDVINTLKKKFPEVVFVYDKVDSAHFDLIDNSNEIGVEIFSLSKVLGLKGGGLLKNNGVFLDFKDREEDEELGLFLEKLKIANKKAASLRQSMMKDDLKFLPTSVKDWLNKNDLILAVKIELESRQKNLKEVLVHKLSNQWPLWMITAVQNGAGPGIVPLLRNCSDEVLLKVKNYLLEVLGVESTVYHFNWSGDPLNSEYEKCLAVPVHGLVKDVKKVLDTMSSQIL